MEKEKFLTWIENTKTSCTLCPRKCAAGRTLHRYGYCRMSDEIIVSRAALHMWEEPCISGTAGSGTVFFSGCNMGCVYCQNYRISRGSATGDVPGRKVPLRELADIFLMLQDKGAANINLVTPTHYSPWIAYALCLAKDQGLKLPVVYNTGGYDSVESLKMLEGLVDIYLPDYKYNSPDRAKRYSNAPDYPDVVKQALTEMYRQVGEVCFDKETGMLKKGMIVRHLVLPDTNRDTKQILRYLHEQYGNSIYVSLMHQYTPVYGQLENFSELHERVSDAQYERCVSFAQRIGMENVYIQDSSSATEEFIPDFGG
ncbi:MAG: radical SAM protein [Lachnospiraceae bacterium]|nr:radical SAM protein [Lachnospiraceae bacterium]